MRSGKFELRSSPFNDSRNRILVPTSVYENAHVPITCRWADLNKVWKRNYYTRFVITNPWNSINLLLNYFLNRFGGQYFTCHINLGWK